MYGTHESIRTMYSTDGITDENTYPCVVYCSTGTMYGTYSKYQYIYTVYDERPEEPTNNID